MEIKTTTALQRYFAEIGRRGGQRSKRVLTKEQAKDMVRVREARRAFSRFHSQCFWSFDKGIKVKREDIAWVAEQLMKNGDRAAWEAGSKLCR